MRAANTETAHNNRRMDVCGGCIVVPSDSGVWDSASPPCSPAQPPPRPNYADRCSRCRQRGVSPRPSSHSRLPCGHCRRRVRPRCPAEAQLSQVEYYATLASNIRREMEQLRLWERAMRGAKIAPTAWNRERRRARTFRDDLGGLLDQVEAKLDNMGVC